MTQPRRRTTQKKKADKLQGKMPAIVGVIVLIAVAWMYKDEMKTFVEPRVVDNPPTIELKWTPIGRIDLKDMRGKLIIKDDNALDFTTYKQRIVELGMETGFPVEGVVGKEWEQDYSLSTLHENITILKKGSVTVEFEIQDDAGQKTELRKVIKVIQPEFIKVIGIE